MQQHAQASGTASASAADAARFLLQAGLHADEAEIAAVQAQGCAAWLDGQLARPASGPSRYDWMQAQGYADKAHLSSFSGADAASWRKLIAADDPLRQRMALALSELFVVSMAGLRMPWRGFAIAHYADLLEQHAFGNFRDLLEAVTLSVAMGEYLNLRGNRSEDERTGRQPDENFARELMQLFSIGPWLLEPDGRPKRHGGQGQDSYTQDDVSQLARVCTGWDFERPSRDDPAWVRRPMQHIASRFQRGDKRLLGQLIPASATGPEALRRALDILFQHPNTGPFVARQLIQRYTQSHPSPAYVARIAAVFADNGSGQRGDLKAVLRALLLDPEARSAGEVSGKLRAPMLRFVQFARCFGMRSASERWAIGDTSDPATRLGQSPWRSPSVFNFYRPGFVPPAGELGRRQITAPEFQICNESSVAGYLNFLQQLLEEGIGDLRPDFQPWLPRAADPEALLGQLDLRLTGGQLSAGARAQIAAALRSIDVDSETGRLQRVRAAVLLLMASPDYLVQR
jgi:uncharacterized protein (DUF1800 family)